MIRGIREISYLLNFFKAYKRLKESKPFALSFDITSRCNLHCQYCYWWKNRVNKELSLNQIVKIASSYRKQGFVQANWIGGEPTLRPDVLRAVTSIFPVNWIVTNGIPVSSFDPFTLKNTWIVLSLDGVGEIHDKSRGKDQLYETIKKRFWQKPILTSTTLHKGNKDQPEKLLKEWSKSKINGMIFEFATPIGKKDGVGFEIPMAERDEIINNLISLKKKYGRFLVNSVRSLELLRSSNLPKWASRKNCLVARYVVSLDELGKVKKPCVFGTSLKRGSRSLPDCAVCGCHIPVMLEGLDNLNFDDLLGLGWFLKPVR